MQFVVAVVVSLVDPLVLVGGLVIGALCPRPLAAAIAGFAWGVAMLLLVVALAPPQLLPLPGVMVAAKVLAGALAVGLGYGCRRLVKSI